MFGILYEDNHLIIYNKPPGMLVQWDKDRIVKPLEELAKDYQREKKGKEPESPRLAKALKAFDKYGIYGLALLGPALIGTQFAALGAVAAGVKPLKASIVVTVGMVVWIIAFAWVLVVLGFALR